MRKYRGVNIFYIINANAGLEKASDLEQRLKKCISQGTIFITKNCRELDACFEDVEKEINRKTSKRKRGKYVYVAVGGDGTVRQLAKRVSLSGNILGIIPCGSGNGLAREIGLPKKLQDQVKVIEEGHTRYLDLLNVDGHTGINIAGLGFDADVALRFSRSGRRGLSGYILAVLRSAMFFHPFHARIRFGENKLEGEYWMISFANSGQFGNNARIAPSAVPDDGYMDVVMVKPFPVYMFPVFLFRLFTGRLKDSKYVKYLKTTGPVKIASPEVHLHVDGDVVTMEDELTVEIVPGVLQVLAPGRDCYSWKRFLH